MAESLARGARLWLGRRGRRGRIRPDRLPQIDLHEGVAELSYWVLPEVRGRGIEHRSVAALTNWSFDVLGLHRIELNHSTQNPASCRVAERAGYPEEGIKRSSAMHLDGWHDMHQHARIAADPGLV